MITPSKEISNFEVKESASSQEKSGYESEASTLNQGKSGSGSKVITSSKGKSGFEQKMITSNQRKSNFSQKKISPPASQIVDITTPQKQHGLSHFDVKSFLLKWLEHAGCPLDHPVLRVE